MLLSRLVVAGTFCTWLMVLGVGVASGQDFPNKLIRIVSTEAGGGADSNARPIAQKLAGNLGQQVIVENRPGVTAAESVAKAPPDGYTLLVNGSSFWIGPLLQKAPYDPVSDFAPITLATTSPLLLVVHPSLRVKSVKELIALAKSKPGELNYGSSPAGSSAHLAAELFKSTAGVNIVRVPYKGGGPAVIDLVGGQVQLMFSVAGLVTPHVKSGRLRALGVTSAQPSALFPDLPTVAASGLSGYESVNRFAVLAPAKTPTVLINRLNQEIVRVLNSPDVKEKFLYAGVETVGSSPEQLAAAIKSEMATVGKVIKDAGIKLE